MQIQHFSNYTAGKFSFFVIPFLFCNIYVLLVNLLIYLFGYLFYFKTLLEKYLRN